MQQKLFAKRKNVTKDEFLSVIESSYGLLEPIEKALNCTRECLRELIKKYPELQRELDDERERVKDRIIKAAYIDAIEGSASERAKARELLLKAMAKDRGFGNERMELPTQGAPMIILHSAPKPLPMQEWQRRASDYAAAEDAVIDAKIKDVMSGKLIGNGKSNEYPGRK